MVVAVDPGTFDPLTRGHEDLVRRASSIFDTLVVGVADSRNKKPFFTLDERLEIAHEVLGHYPNVQVMSFKGLLKDFVRTNNARVIVRGPDGGKSEFALDTGARRSVLLGRAPDPGAVPRAPHDQGPRHIDDRPPGRPVKYGCYIACCNVARGRPVAGRYFQ